MKVLYLLVLSLLFFSLNCCKKEKVAERKSLKVETNKNYNEIVKVEPSYKTTPFFNKVQTSPVKHREVHFSKKPEDQFSVEEVESEILEDWSKLYPDLQNVPVWKRREIAVIRKSYTKIVDEAKAEAKNLKNLSIAEQRKWNREWNTKNKDKLKNLKREESLLIHFQAHEIDFTYEELDEVQFKVTSPNSQFNIKDMAMLESLLSTRSRYKQRDGKLIVDREKLRKRYIQLSKYYN